VEKNKVEDKDGLTEEEGARGKPQE
jgi:hypothetical protein